MAKALQTTRALPLCPCCAGSQIQARGETYCCQQCLHVWREIASEQVETDYRMQEGRNAMPAESLAAKFNDRLNALAPYLTSGQQIVEVGCAEGELGARIKQAYQVIYTGLELSRDADEARKVLDKVSQHPEELPSEHFNLMLAFHVLEHIADVAEALERWMRLLTPEGRLVLEVPNQAGHPWLEEDANREHIHQFDTASLCSLLRRSGLQILKLETGCFESPCYPDSIRVVACRALEPELRRHRLITAVNNTLGGAFDVFAIGGDFNTYLLPIIDNLPVKYLFDNQPRQQEIKTLPVSAFSLDVNAGRPVLISTVRYEQAIFSQLIATGVNKAKIHFLSDILMQVKNG